MGKIFEGEQACWDHGIVSDVVVDYMGVPVPVDGTGVGPLERLDGWNGLRTELSWPRSLRLDSAKQVRT
jgi:hypothetical protein